MSRDETSGEVVREVRLRLLLPAITLPWTEPVCCAYQDGQYCLVWGGTHQHSWIKPDKLRDFRDKAPEFSALIRADKRADFREAVDEARKGRLKEWDRVLTARGREAAPAVVAESKQWFWTEEEERELLHLIDEEGTGDWEGKADRLGTGRGVASVRSRWFDFIRPRMQENNGKYEFIAPARFVDHPGEPWRKDETRKRRSCNDHSPAKASAKRPKQAAGSSKEQSPGPRRPKANQHTKPEVNSGLQEPAPPRRFRHPTDSEMLESRRSIRKPASSTGMIDLVRPGHGSPTEAKQFDELVDMGFPKEDVADAARKAHGVFERTLQILLNPRSRELQLGEGSYIDGSPVHQKLSQDARTSDASCAPTPPAPVQKEKWTEPEVEKLRGVIESISSGRSDSNGNGSGISLPWDEIARKMGTGRGVEAYRMRWHRLIKQSKQPGTSLPIPAKAAIKMIAVASSGVGALAYDAAVRPRKLRRVSTTDHPNQIKIESDNPASAAPRPADALETSTIQRREWDEREQVTLLRLVQELGVTFTSDSTGWQAVADRLGTDRTGTAVAHRYRLLTNGKLTGNLGKPQKNEKIPQHREIGVKTENKCTKPSTTQETQQTKLDHGSSRRSLQTDQAVQNSGSAKPTKERTVEKGLEQEAPRQEADSTARSSRVRKAPERWVNDALSVVNLGGRADLFEKVVSGEVTSQESAKQVKTKDPKSCATILEAIAQSEKAMAKRADDAAQAKRAAELKKTLAAAARRTAKRPLIPSRLRRKPAFPRRYDDGRSALPKPAAIAEPAAPECSDTASRDGQPEHTSISTSSETDGAPDTEGGVPGRARRERKKVQRWADDPLATVDLGGSMDKREAVVTGKIDIRGEATDANWVPPKVSLWTRSLDTHT